MENLCNILILRGDIVGQRLIRWTWDLLEQRTPLPQCPSSPRCINGYQLPAGEAFVKLILDSNYVMNIQCN